ncbi:MarR family winged helix-turn-helix transcriptional regulator [Phenylobacterium sp. J367]|uniref:MarR family winged helix-turn-helix transcriptional regulator n=1 Tax=Phenylobacterium sp. J367 TaxID=2898435 RepID=UPI002150ED4F|nr:MarR family transcriptional regulator [Phenylobacterium sp. J367]MCR5879820.1 MarR family transcriptional regulator [Phenylobacterium sp. J367]
MPPRPAPATNPDEDIVDVDLGVLNDVIGFRLRRIQNHLSRGFSDRIARKEIKPGSFSALALIAANPGLSQTTLSREIGFDKATVVAILDALEDLGWAERKRSIADRRRHALYVTRSGEKALQKMLDEAHANEKAIHAALSPDEQQQLFALLDKIYGACFSDITR